MRNKGTGRGEKASRTLRSTFTEDRFDESGDDRGEGASLASQSTFKNVRAGGPAGRGGQLSQEELRRDGQL